MATKSELIKAYQPFNLFDWQNDGRCGYCTNTKRNSSQDSTTAIPIEPCPDPIGKSSTGTDTKFNPLKRSSQCPLQALQLSR